MRATFGLLLALAATMSPIAASADDSAAMRSFVQMCTGYQTMSNARFATLARRQYAEFASAYVPDVSVVDALKRALPSWSRVTIEDRAFQALQPSTQHVKSVLVKIQQGVKTRFAVASFTASNAFVRLAPISDVAAARYFNFARGMASYMLLNDLMQSDAVIPRLGCVRAAKIQLNSFPGILKEVDAAFMTLPVLKPAFLKRIQDAYGRFASSKRAQDNPFTSNTLHKLGANPTIELVFRSAPGIDTEAGEYDIVRLSRGATRTYAELFVRGSVFQMDSPGLCVVGDVRCVPYYVWP